MTLPPLGEFAVGMIFVNAKDKVEEVMKAFEGYANECEMKVTLPKCSLKDNLDSPF